MNDTIVSSNLHGVIAIVNERNDQIHKHGFTVEHDIQHNPNGELVVAARALMKDNPTLHDFPQHWGVAYCRKLILKPLTDRYIIAGTLLAAEVDRRRYIQKVMRETPKKIAKDYPLTPDEAFKISNESNRNI